MPPLLEDGVDGADTAARRDDDGVDGAAAMLLSLQLPKPLH